MKLSLINCSLPATVLNLPNSATNSLGILGFLLAICVTFESNTSASFTFDSLYLLSDTLSSLLSNNPPIPVEPDLSDLDVLFINPPKPVPLESSVKLFKIFNFVLALVFVSFNIACLISSILAGDTCFTFSGVVKIFWFSLGKSPLSFIYCKNFSALLDFTRVSYMSLLPPSA